LSFTALVLYSLNTANIRYTRTSEWEVHAHRAWTILSLACNRSLGGNRM